jgi:hypothetical protein
MRKTLGYMALGSALWRGFRWYRGRRNSAKRWQSVNTPAYRNDLTRQEMDDIDLRTGAEQSASLRREPWE